MKVVELVEAARKANPKAFGKVEDAQAKRIAVAVLEEIGRTIESTQEGPVIVARLGRFAVKNVPQKDNPGATKRRVIFVRGKAGGGTALA